MHKARCEGISMEFAMACSGLGLCGELGELRAPGADVLLEAGDVLSYALNLAYLWELDASLWIREAHLVEVEACARAHGEGGRYPKALEWLLDEAVTHGLAAAELVKKRAFQGRIVECNEVAWRLRSIVQCVAGYTALRGISMQNVMIANSVKLSNRFPEAAELASAAG